MRIYNKRGAGEAENRRERMQDLAVRVQRVVAEVVAEECVPLATMKEESMVLCGGWEEEEKGWGHREGEVVRSHP